ncbi:MAG TPA: site-specific integrase [Acidimicrobiia bacterium]
MDTRDERLIAAQDAARSRPTRTRDRFAADALSEWSKAYFTAAVHKRATTLARDKTVNEKHFVAAFGSRTLSSLRPLDVRRVVETMSQTLAPATIRTNYGVLRAIMNAAVQSELIAVSPCRAVKLPAAKRREIRFLNAEDLRALADTTPAEYRPMIYLAGVLGLRWSEVAGLRVGRVNFLRKTVEIAETCSEVNGRIAFADTKTRASRRTLSVPSFVLTMLSEHVVTRGRPGADELLFVAPEGGPLRRSTFRTRVFDPAVKRAGLDGMTFHGLRHTSVGLMIEAGAHIEAMKQRLGHSSIRVTSDVYGSLLPAVDESVTAALEARFAAVTQSASALA